MSTEHSQVKLFPKRRRVRNGEPTNRLVFSASTEGNDTVFPRVLGLYVSPGSVVADVTYGKGVFWRRVPPGAYDLRPTDILDGTDCRDLPYADGAIDCVVLDPPYMHSPGGTAHANGSPFEAHYRNNASGNRTASKYHEAVVELYRDAGERGVPSVARPWRSDREVPRPSVLEPSALHPCGDHGGLPRDWVRGGGSIRSGTE